MWYLFILAGVVLLAVICLAKYVRTQEAARQLHLADNGDHLFYNQLIKNVLPNHNNSEILSAFLELIHCTAAVDDIYIGENLGSIVLNYDPDYDVANILDLRVIVGMPTEMVIIKDTQMKQDFQGFHHSLSDLSYIGYLIDNNILERVLTSMKYVIEARCAHLTKINPSILTGRGFVYLPDPIPNCELLKTENGYRVNLLCSLNDFEEMASRLKQLQS